MLNVTFTVLLPWEICIALHTAIWSEAVWYKVQNCVNFSEAIAQFGLLYFAVGTLFTDNSASMTLNGQCFGQCGQIL